MRMSSNKDDPGFDAWMALGDRRSKVKVLLDGVEVKNVTVADEGKGVVWRAAAGADGKLRVEDGEIVQEIVGGKVQIVLPDAA